MPPALLRVLTATSVAGAVLVGTPPAAAVAHARPLPPVPAVQEPPPAATSVPARPSLAVRPVGDAPVGPDLPPVTTPAGARLAGEVAAAAAAVQERQGLGRQAPDVRGVLPDSSRARPLTPVPIGGSGGRGVPGVFYRLCVESADVPVSCSLRRPVGTPVAADVTGDAVPDLAADLTPAAGAADGTIGLRFAVRRTGKARVQARVWAEYDGRVSVGFDGLGGGSLSDSDRGTFTVDRTGRRVTATVERSGPGASAAIVAGLAGRGAVRLRQTPATARLTIEAALDPPVLDLAASRPATVEALAVTGDRFTEAVLDRMPARARVRLSGGEVRFTGSSPVARAQVRHFAYRDGRLDRAVLAEVSRVPASFRAAFASTGRAQTLAVDAGRGRAPSGTLTFFDRAAARTVIRAELTGLPARVRLAGDLAANRVTLTTSSPIGRLAVLLQRNGGAIASPRGDHLTLIKDGDATGVSALLSGLSGLDVRYGAAPRARLETGSPGRSFLGAASVDGTRLARLEVSGLPATVDVGLDPAAGRAAYRAGGAVRRVRAAYTDTRSGPTVDATVLGVRDDVTASWRLGARSAATVSTGSRIDRVRIYANRAHVTRRTGEDLQVTVEGVRERAELVADTGAKTLTWTAGAPVPKVSALARATLGGRYVRAAAEVRGVPARFDASWDASAYRFRGLSGPVGSAALAFANHDGATAPAGPHLAAHYREATGDLDASVLVEGLSQVELSASPGGFTAGFRAAGQKLAVDADVTRGDDRFGLSGTLGPAPGRLSVTSDGGRLTYTGSRLDLRARAWLGTAAALDRTPPAPAVPGGVSLVDGGCAAGTRGCAPGAFCLPSRGCFGLRGDIDVRGLPERVTVDPAAGTFAFAGFRPRVRSLGVYLASSVLSPVPVKARATLTGLPAAITGLSVGPIGVAPGNAVRAAYRIEPAATLGSLDVLAEAGGVRGHVALDPVPAAVDVQGAYGARTRVRVRNSAAVERLSAEVTVPGRGSGGLRLSDVPARFAVDADASGAALGVPAVTYRAEDGLSTLDGRLRVEGGLVDPGGRLGEVSLAVEDLAADTTVLVNPDQSVDLVSRPVPTGRVVLHAGLRLDPVARQRLAVRKEVPYTGGFLAYRVEGWFGLGRSAVGDVGLSERRVERLRIRPGRIPFGLTASPALGYVAPAFEGSYGTVTVTARDVDLRPDVALDVRLSRAAGADVFHDSVRLTPAGRLALRRYDQRMRGIGARQEIEAAGIGLACVRVAARPGFAAAGDGRVTLRGADGPQLVSLLDLGGQAPDYAVDLLASFMSPFPGADWQVSGADAGGCGRRPASR
ncbi:hypothetical protein MF672_037245 [Actinomadura sp. ATCC 31491]|uniref:Uncharacterized protein n=1 Tax=Actinomadura luzonensis TaxID=2805427 RepID=A0ABT0G4H2_9ACTN|nr:hypothetical protein [Actinomadura luzonensis]MCK2219404.1 hypothetical protein [Actinomadura luzonensis]